MHLDRLVFYIGNTDKTVIVTLTFFYASLSYFGVKMLKWVRFGLESSVNGKLCTPCASALVRCTPVASPVNKFVEIVSPAPNYAFSAFKWISFLPQWLRDFIPGDIWKNWEPPLIKSIFSMVLGLLTNYATWLRRFRIKNSAMDTGYLVF